MSFRSKILKHSRSGLPRIVISARISNCGRTTATRFHSGDMNNTPALIHAFGMKPNALPMKDDAFLPTHVKVRAVMVGAGKTTAAKRSVPLSAKAGAILAQLGDEVFDLNAKTADALWRTKICEKACIEGLHFHDSRHEACTRLASKLDLLELAEMMGIVDLKTLKEVYYNPKVEDLYARLNEH